MVIRLSKRGGFAVLLIGLTIGMIVGFNLGKTPTASTTTISTGSSNSSDPVSTGDPCGVPNRCTIPFTVSYVHGRASMETYGIAQVITFSNEKTGTLSSGVNYDPNSQQYQEYFLYLPVNVQYQVIISQDGARSDTRPACNAMPYNFTPIDASDQVQDFVC